VTTVGSGVNMAGSGRLVAMVLVREHPLPTEGIREMLNPKMLAKFQSKIVKGVINPEHGECWIWKPPSQNGGYGRFYLGRDDEGRQHYRGSHVTSYMHFVGPIPQDWIVDHMCTNKACCNPDHLECIPNLENLRRAHQRRPWKRLNQFEADHNSEPDWRLSLGTSRDPAEAKP